MKYASRLGVAVACSLALGSGLAQASSFTCDGAGVCTGIGDTVTFKFTGSWDTNTSTYVPVMNGFGELHVSGDVIYAVPTDFLAQSIEGVGTHSGLTTDVYSKTGTVEIFAKSGYAFDSITVSETGDYQMLGDDSWVDVNGYLRMYDLNDPAPTYGTEEIISNMPITGDLTIADGNNHTWSASGTMDMTTAKWEGVFGVGLTLQNTLKAYSIDATAGSEYAFIQKKAVGAEAIGFEIVTNPVPVPAAVWLFGSGLLGLVGVARRRRS